MNPVSFLLMMIGAAMIFWAAMGDVVERLERIENLLLDEEEEE